MGISCIKTIMSIILNLTVDCRRIILKKNRCFRRMKILYQELLL